MLRPEIFRWALNELGLPPSTTWAQLWLWLIDCRKVDCPVAAGVETELADKLDGARPMF